MPSVGSGRERPGANFVKEDEGGGSIAVTQRRKKTRKMENAGTLRFGLVGDKKCQS